MTAAWRKPQAWPLRIKVPLLVAGLMILVGLVTSQLVLDRFARTQQAHLRALSNAYLDGTAAAVMPHVLRRDIWEAYDVLDRSRTLYEGLSVVDTMVVLPDGLVLAATDPERFSTLRPLPAGFWQPDGRVRDLVMDDAQGQVTLERELDSGGAVIGTVLARADISTLLAERREVLATLILLNAAVTSTLAAIGYLAVRQMLAPVALLTAHVETLRDGRMAAIPAALVGDERTEFGRLFSRFNAMAASVAEREALATRLAEEEKLAQLGRLASGMAHEVNNPLGGMQNALATLRKHGNASDIRARALDLLERGLNGIRNVVRATLVTYKDRPECRRLAPADLDDLQYLIQHEVARRQLRVTWINDMPGAIAVDRSSLRQALLNLLLNACAASPVKGEVRFEATLAERGLRVAITDSGSGLPKPFAGMLKQLDDARLPDGSGLGIWTSSRLIKGVGGRLEVDYPKDGGTRIVAIVPAGAEDALHAVA